ncbi:MAG TPA: DUF4349 domain-containing protein, partial [Planctomycetota bacterium]|nr:DUF4349 domain-containing protein [Planctomycetota bacterium]
KPPPEPAKPPVQQPPAPTQRKIIRSGEVEFEIDGFDNAVARVTQIASEEGGFIQTVSSDRLANGKVRGVVVVRVPPERVDTLLLKLRALGDLKSSQIGSQDVTKQYYDLESRLRAARTMEERLLRIIKEGKGEIKDLLLAEKELGEWRTRIEQFEGEIRYYNNLIGLSTITLTLTEKDIRSASAVVRIERVDMGLEVEDVEKAHRAALEAVGEAKGRVTRSELKQHAAGQFNAIVEFEVAPAASGPLRDRLKQLGTLSRLEVNTIEEVEGGGPVKGSDVRVTQKDSRFSVSIYNLANLAPRETVHLNLAALDAEETYKAVVARIEKAGGRIVTSQLNRQKNDQTTGLIHAEVKSPEADAVLLDVRGTGEVMRLQIVEAAEGAQATKSKRGFRIQIFALGAVAPRETTTLRLASADVPAAFKALLEAARQGGGRILVSQLLQGDRRSVSARLDFDVRRPADAAIETALGAAGETLSRNVHRVEDHENVVDSKVRYTLTFVDLGTLAAREATTLQLAVKDVPAAYRALTEAVRKAGGWVHVSTMNETDRQNVTASLTFDVRREHEAAVVAALASAGVAYTRAVQRAAEGSDAADTKVRFALAIFDQAKVPPRETHTIALEASRVDESVKALEAAAVELKGRVLDRTDARDSATGRQTTTVLLEVPLGASPGVLQRIKDLGLSIRSREAHKNPQVPEGDLARAQMSITVSNDLLLAPDSGPWTNIKRGLAVSLTAGSYALMLIMIGVCFILPLALLVWGGIRVYRRIKPKAA